MAKCSIFSEYYVSFWSAAFMVGAAQPKPRSSGTILNFVRFAFSAISTFALAIRVKRKAIVDFFYDSKYVA
jgi:hypothetical protein